MTQAQETMRRIGIQLIEEKKRAVVLEKEDSRWPEGGQIGGNKGTAGRDLLSVLSPFTLLRLHFDAAELLVT